MTGERIKMSQIGNIENEELLKLKQIRGGKLLARLRNDLDLKQKQVAKKVGLSFQYLSQIENGEKSPSDLLLHDLAELYGLGIDGETELFHTFGRVAIYATEELLDRAATIAVLADLRKLVRKGKISDEQRQELYNEWDRVYADFKNRILKEDD